MSAPKQFMGCTVMPGSKTHDLLESGKPEDLKLAKKMVAALNKMRDGYYTLEVVQKVRAENPELF